MSDIKDFVIEDGVLKKHTGNETEVVIPEGVEKIGDSAFYCCTNLTTINIPDSVMSIGISAFEGCENLTIHAPAGSYAEQYAKKKKINFVAE